MKLVMSTMCLILLVAGCGGPDSDATDTGEAETPGGAIGAGYVEALEDAEALDELGRERKDRLDEALEPPE
jgi:hypothetical protein